VVDQFEEVFTLCGEEDRQWLIDALVRCPRVVIGVRADFYGHCGQHTELVEALRGNQILVGPMTSDELRRAITEPAAQVGAKVETALVARLMSDMAGHHAALALVSHALAETWRRRRSSTLTLAAYEEAGGVEHAIARTAENVFTELSEDERRAARRLFLRLVALGEGTEDTKRRVRRNELEMATAMLDRLAAARLISLERDWAELTHEALIRAWPRLRAWLDEDRERLRIHREVTDATTAWEAHDRDPDLLYRGTRLARAREHLTDDLSGAEQEFVAASTALEQHQQAAARRRTRRLNQLVAFLSVLTLLLVGTVVYAVGAERDAVRERNTALALRAASDAIALVSGDARTAVKVALAAHSLAATPETAEALISTHAASHRLPVGDGKELHSDVMISARSTVAVTVGSYDSSERRQAALWILPGGSPVRTAELDFFHGWAEISADARTMVVLDQEPFRTSVWNLSNPAAPWKVAVLPAPHNPRALSDDGRIALTDQVTKVDGRPQGSYAAAALWDLTDPAGPRQIPLPPNTSFVLALRPDGNELATHRMSSSDSVIDFWRREPGDTWHRTTSWQPGGDWDASLHYAANGRFVTLRHKSQPRMAVWRLRDAGEPEKWAEVDLENPSQTRSFLPGDGRFLFTETTGVLRVWDIGRQHEPRLHRTVRGYSTLGSLTSLATADDDFLLYDNRLGIWHLDLDVQRVVSRLCSEDDHELSADRWTQQFPGVPQSSPCPGS
jgi:hypothetical protein